MGSQAADDVLSRYPGVVGGSQTLDLIGSRQGNGAPVASWALSVSGVGGFQTGGSNLTLQRFAVAAYQASQRPS